MRRVWKAAVAAIVIASLPAAAANNNEPGPAIREFDLATIEKLGRAMYEQDQFAWKATDAIREHLRGQNTDLAAEGARGWIVLTLADRTRVRWVREREGALEAAYDVDFAGTARPAVSVPADRTLTPAEIGQHKARRLALAEIERPCSRNYNTVALKDPRSDDWLVWAMAATTERGVVVVGGHYRFTISPDGTRVIRRDALSRGCLQIADLNAPQREQPVGSYASHYVSLTPIETHVFISVGQPVPFYVGTLDGTVWKLDGGRIGTVEQDSAGSDGFMARAAAGTEEFCNPVLARPDGKFEIGNEMKVIEPTERADRLTLPAVARDRRVASVACGRQTIVPAPNDYKVLLAGVPLFILDKGAGHPPDRMASLEVVNGRLHLRMVDGRLTPAEEVRVKRRLDAMQPAFAAAAPPRREPSPTDDAAK